MRDACAALLDQICFPGEEIRLLLDEGRAREVRLAETAKTLRNGSPQTRELFLWTIMHPRRRHPTIVTNVILFLLDYLAN